MYEYMQVSDKCTACSSSYKRLTRKKRDLKRAEQRLNQLPALAITAEFLTTHYFFIEYTPQSTFL
jgi:hypothetical protein